MLSVPASARTSAVIAAGLIPDVIIVGSGPAGVSAAWPLVEAGHRVLMVDAGATPLPPPPADRPDLATIRRAGRPDWLLGPRLEHLRDIGNASPKLRTAATRSFEAGFLDLNRIDGRGFRPIGALIPGGLSSVWGAVASTLNAADLARWPAAAAAGLVESYRRVAGRIGLSGDCDDARRLGIGGDVPLQSPLDLSPSAQSLLVRARHRPDSGLVMGRPVSAVLTQPRDGREACSLSRACMWGCARPGAVYSSADELPVLGRRDNFHFMPGTKVIGIERLAEGWRVRARRSEGEVELAAPKVVLAAGPLASTRLALMAAGRTSDTLAFENTPAFGFAILLPHRVGSAQPERGYGNAQLCFRLGGAPDSPLGLLYDADVIAPADIADRMPFSRPGAATLVRTLQSAMMLGLLYLDGRHSANRLYLAPDSEGFRLVVEGGGAAGSDTAFRQALAEMSGALRRLGAWVLPGSVSQLEPGAEIHVGATLPMGRETDEMGGLKAAPGLHLVDSASLPSITPKHHTFTVMANADRIGQILARS